MKAEAADGMVVVGVEGAATDYWGNVAAKEELTPLEAERVIKEMRKAIDAARAQTASRKKLGDY